MSLEEKMGGVNLTKYIRSEVSEIYKLFREKVSNGKKSASEEELLEMFNPYESSLKSFKYFEKLKTKKNTYCLPQEL